MRWCMRRRGARTKKFSSRSWPDRFATGREWLLPIPISGLQIFQANLRKTQARRAVVSKKNFSRLDAELSKAVAARDALKKSQTYRQPLFQWSLKPSPGQRGARDVVRDPGR